MLYTEKNQKEFQRKMYIYKRELFNLFPDLGEIGRMVGEAATNGEITEDLSQAILGKLEDIYHRVNESLFDAGKAAGEIP